MKRRNIKIRPTKRLTITTFESGVDCTNDPLVGSESSARICTNFDSTYGALKDPPGLERVEFFVGDRIWAMAGLEREEPYGDRLRQYLVVVNTAGRILYRDMSKENPDPDYHYAAEPLFTQPPQIIPYVLNDSPTLLFSNKNQGLAYWSGTEQGPTIVENAPKVTSMAIHAERLFVTIDGESDTVWFSDDLDPTNWEISLDGAGFIRLTGERGSCEKVVSFGGCLYVFRSFGITRITAYAEQTEFTVTDLFTSGGKICPQSITVCGNRILFLSSDGLFSFDGSTATRIAPALAPLFVPTGFETAAFWKGKYYLATGADVGEGVPNEGNNLLLVYDVYTKKSVLYDHLDVRGLYGLTLIDQFFVVLHNGWTYRFTSTPGIDGTPLPRKWKSMETPLGSNDKKCVKTVSLFLDGSCRLTVGCDGEMHIYDNLTANGGVVEVPVRLSGRSFSFAVTSSSPRCTVSRLSVVFT